MSTATAAAPTLSAARTGVALLAALVVNVAVRLVGGAGGATFDAGLAQPVSVPAVVVLTLVPPLLALGALGLLAQRWPAAWRVAPWAGAAVALVSVAVPLTRAAEPTTAIALATMHLVVGAAWLWTTLPRATVPAA